MRVVVAMSGGVDSAVAAARCVHAGHEVIGISLRWRATGPAAVAPSRTSKTPGRRRAARLPHYVFDFTDVFEREWCGRSSPSISRPHAEPVRRCNEHVKFGLLWRRRGARRGAARHRHYAASASTPRAAARISGPRPTQPGPDLLPLRASPTGI